MKAKAKNATKGNGISKKEENQAKKLVAKVSRNLTKAEKSVKKMLKLRKKVDRQLKKVKPLIGDISPKTKAGHKNLAALTAQVKSLQQGI